MPLKGRNLKAQSAMEYLMTYGWAILIIAIVLGALFSLGVFSGSSFIGTACIPASGYTCSSVSFFSGTFNAVLGQATGTSWSTANIVFIVGGGTPPSINSGNTITTSGSGVCVASNSGGLSSGQTFTASFTGYVSTSSNIAGTGVATCTSLPTAIGTTESGALWAAYQTSAITGVQWTQLATVTLKET